MEVFVIHFLRHYQVLSTIVKSLEITLITLVLDNIMQVQCLEDYFSQAHFCILCIELELFI